MPKIKMDITVFFENLATAWAVSNKEILKRLRSHIDGDTLYLQIRAEKQGLRQCINATQYEVKPTGEKHKMRIDEIFVGYDAEGYHWSDHMFGQIVDCNGLGIDRAIDLIVENVNKMMKRG